MSTIDPGLSALSTWYQQRITQPSGKVPQGKALLKRENGTLRPINTADLEIRDKILCFLSRFFGIGNYALHNVAAIAQRLIEQNPDIVRNLPELIPTFNHAIDDYNSSTTSLKSLEYLSCLFPHIKLCIPCLHTYVSHSIQSLICKKIHAIYSRDLRDVVLV